LERFYVTVDQVLHERFDGLVITGAGGNLPFEQVDYWDELVSLLDYATTNVFLPCIFAGVPRRACIVVNGIPKKALDKKLFGVFPHSINERKHPLFRGFDDVFLAPQSRHTESDRRAIGRHPLLTVQSETEEVGIFMVTARDGREIYVSGHLEYDPWTLDREYRRDVSKGLPIEIPKNYYRNDDPTLPPEVRWRAHAHLFFSNWVNYVYQETPYDLADLR